MMVYVDRMAYDELCVMHTTFDDRPMEEQLAAALRESREVFAKDPEGWHNNPAKKREALEGLGRVLAEWQEENGAFTEEELARARARVSGVDVRS